MIPKWEKFPSNMKNECVKSYYDIVSSKKASLVFKRVFDIVFSVILIIFLLPVMVLISIMIKFDSPGKIFYKQKRITQYGREFFIIKFRTMRDDINIKSSITCENDPRVTKIGKILRKFRLDEFPQLVNVLLGDMSFVGTRPEVEEYVKFYDDKMLSTLILPAGITSVCSIEFKDEERYLKNSDNISKTYVDCILPKKMIYNIQYMENFSFIYDLKIMLMTFIKVFLR